MSQEENDLLASKLKVQIEAKAAEFAVSPEKGFAAGYSPEHLYRRPREIGRDELVKVRSDLAAWLCGVARKDLRPGCW